MHVKPVLDITDRSKAVLLLWFTLIVIVRPLSVSLKLFVHFIGQPYGHLLEKS